MIDYHCHLLPGLDDGPKSAEESVEMARALVAFGFREVCCTPHCIRGHYEISPVEVREAVRKLQSRLDYEEVALTLHSGMEYYLDEHFERFSANLLPLGESRVVLCEAPPQARPGLVAEMAGLIVAQGFIPLVAHPERTEVIWTMLEQQRLALTGKASADDQAIPPASDTEPADRRPAFWRRWFSPQTSASRPALARNDADLAELPEEALFQANLGSFAGFYGDKVQRRAYDLLQRNGYHCFASDLHDASSIPEGLAAAREKLEFNPALQRLAAFVAPRGAGGSPQMAFW